MQLVYLEGLLNLDSDNLECFFCDFSDILIRFQLSHLVFKKFSFNMVTGSQRYFFTSLYLLFSLNLNSKSFLHGSLFLVFWQNILPDGFLLTSKTCGLQKLQTSVLQNLKLLLCFQNWRSQLRFHFNSQKNW